MRRKDGTLSGLIFRHLRFNLFFEIRGYCLAVVRGGEYLNYSTLANCSLIFSSSSFI